MIILDGLDEIDWANIQHSHGTSEKFPFHLRELAKNDPTTWEQSRDYIREYSDHQNTIYDVTPYVAPFVLMLLKALPVNRTYDLLDILAGYAWSIDNQHNQEWVDRMEHGVKQGWFTQEYFDSSMKPIDDTRAFLEANLDFFLTYLEHEQPDIRAAAVQLLYAFRHIPQISEALEKRDRLETHEYVRKALQYGLNTHF